MEAFLNKKYKFDRPGETFNEYLVALGKSCFVQLNLK